jgi:hypothetical protein
VRTADGEHFAQVKWQEIESFLTAEEKKTVNDSYQFV